MKIVLADDHPFTLLGTSKFLESLGYEVFTAQTGKQTLTLVEEQKPDITILDINMPDMDGFEVAQKINDWQIHTKIIFLTMHKEKIVYQKALKYNPYGFLLKDDPQEELMNCLETVKNGEIYKSPDFENNSSIFTTGLESLTLQEKKVLELIAAQKTSKQIADLLFVTEKTIEGHRRNIIRKLELPQEKNALLTWAVAYFSV